MANSSQSGNILGYASGTQPGLVSTVAQTFAGAKTFSNGLVFDSSSLSDAQATILGLKQYLHGTTYNGGNAPTVTSGQAGFTVTRAVFIPYQCQDGTWRLKFNLASDFTSASISSIIVSINGITSKSTYTQAVSGLFGTYSIGVKAFLQSNSNQLNAIVSSAGTANAIYFSGDVELNAKPTWAY